MSEYATIADVREDVGQLLKDEVYVLAASGPATVNSIVLPDNNTKAIASISLNGAPLVVTVDYTFQAPKTIAFTAPKNLNDRVEVSRDTHMSDEQIRKQIVWVSNYIDTQLGGVYDVPFEAIYGDDEDAYPDIISTLAVKLSSAEIRMKLFDSTDTGGDIRGTKQWDRWHKKLMELRDQIVVIPGIDISVASGGIYTGEETEPIFDLNDVPDLPQLSGRTGYSRRRKGF